MARTSREDGFTLLAHSDRRHTVLAFLTVAMLVAIVAIPSTAQASLTKSRIKFLNVIPGGGEENYPDSVVMTFSIDATTFASPTVRTRLERWSATKKRYLGYAGKTVKVYRYDLPVGLSKTRIATLVTNSKGEFSFKPSAAGEYLAYYAGNSTTASSARRLDRWDTLEGDVTTTVTTSSVDASTTQCNFDVITHYNPNYRQGSFLIGENLPWDSPTIRVEPWVIGREASGMGVFTGRATDSYVPGQARFTFSTLVPTTWLFDESTGTPLDLDIETSVLFPNPYVYVKRSAHP